ncbi:K+/H+ antiporter subunit F [Geminicoccaceae bacterium 1502E]|nr:K+/H+ antiporter subunit F [Geminicoccaceae bacterium 1502E]
MIALASTIAAGAIGVALLLNLVRLVRGPDMVDRVLALDTMVINAIALILLLGIASEREVYFEGALLFAMVGFISTVAFAKYLLRGDVIE